MTAIDSEFNVALRAMTEREIRRAQDIVNAQIPLAYEQRNTRALEMLQAWDRAYVQEMMRRLQVAA